MFHRGDPAASLHVHCAPAGNVTLRTGCNRGCGNCSGPAIDFPQGVNVSLPVPPGAPSDVHPGMRYVSPYTCSGSLTTTEYANPTGNCSASTDAVVFEATMPLDDCTNGARVSCQNGSVVFGMCAGGCNATQASCVAQAVVPNGTCAMGVVHSCYVPPVAQRPQCALFVAVNISQPAPTTTTTLPPTTVTAAPTTTTAAPTTTVAPAPTGRYPPPPRVLQPSELILECNACIHNATSAIGSFRVLCGTRETRSIAFATGCNRDCSSCTGKRVVLPRTVSRPFTLDPADPMEIAYQSIHSCPGGSASFNTYAGATCTAASLTSRLPMPLDVCIGAVRWVCNGTTPAAQRCTGPSCTECVELSQLGGCNPTMPGADAPRSQFSCAVPPPTAPVPTCILFNSTHVAVEPPTRPPRPPRFVSARLTVRCNTSVAVVTDVLAAATDTDSIDWALADTTPCAMDANGVAVRNVTMEIDVEAVARVRADLEGVPPAPTATAAPGATTDAPAGTTGAALATSAAAIEATLLVSINGLAAGTSPQAQDARSVGILAAAASGPAPSPAAPDDGGSGNGAIIGIGVGAVVGVCVLAGIAAVVVRRRKTQEPSDLQTAMLSAPVEGGGDTFEMAPMPAPTYAPAVPLAQQPQLAPHHAQPAERNADFEDLL